MVVEKDDHAVWSLIIDNYDIFGFDAILFAALGTLLERLSSLE